MPTCTQITDALNVIASATSNPSVLSDLSGQVASLEPVYNGGLNELVQLTAGGDAVLTPSPSLIDGKLFNIIVSGFVTTTTPQSNNSVNISLSLGSSISNLLVNSTVPLDSSASFGYVSMPLTCLWDSVTENLVYWSNTLSPNGSTLIIPNVSSGDLNFYIQTSLSGGLGSVHNTLSVKQLKLQLI